jgi:cell division protein FtsX
MANRFRNDSLRTFIQTSKGKSYTVAAITILLVVVMFIFGVYPAISAIVAQINDNATRESVLSQIETKRDTLRTLVQTEQSS